MATNDDLKAKIVAIVSQHMYASDADDILDIVEILCRKEYNRGYNSATKQFGAYKEFFKGDIPDD